MFDQEVNNTKSMICYHIVIINTESSGTLIATRNRNSFSVWKPKVVDLNSVSLLKASVSGLLSSILTFTQQRIMYWSPTVYFQVKFCQVLASETGISKYFVSV